MRILRRVVARWPRRGANLTLWEMPSLVKVRLELEQRVHTFVNTTCRALRENHDGDAHVRIYIAALRNTWMGDLSLLERHHVHSRYSKPAFLAISDTWRTRKEIQASQDCLCGLHRITMYSSLNTKLQMDTHQTPTSAHAHAYNKAQAGTQPSTTLVVSVYAALRLTCQQSYLQT